MYSNFDSEFSPITYSLSSALEMGLKDSYGTGLNLLLIQYRFDGDVNEFPKWTKPISNYNKKEKSIAVRFIVRHKDFHDCTNDERRQYLSTTILKAIELTSERLSNNKNVDIDFNLLNNDAKNILDKWGR
jgi:hypothetical protein